MGEDIEITTTDGQKVRVSLWGVLGEIARSKLDLQDPHRRVWAGGIYVDGKPVDVRIAFSREG